MALYGAPIWADALNKRENAALLRRPQRAIAQRVARTYRTVGNAAACVLAGTPPWELEAGVLSVIYHWMADQKARGKCPAPERRGAVRQEEREIMIDRWKEDMTRAQFGRRTLDAIGPVLDKWLKRPHGFLTFRLAQVLTGHGCFGSYLHRTGREESPCATNAARRMTRCSTPSRSAQAGRGSAVSSLRSWAGIFRFRACLVNVSRSHPSERGSGARAGEQSSCLIAPQAEKRVEKAVVRPF
ncbi:uncharacterized protein LOC135088159 [Ostrinia nubilalis]|uniref:uncharacterized protein LOC135088159 n=1 Tax=Ostrinia nubilalis TaxID=29057 RepID=UPI0030825F55